MIDDVQGRAKQTICVVSPARGHKENLLYDSFVTCFIG